VAGFGRNTQYDDNSGKRAGFYDQIVGKDSYVSTSTCEKRT